MPHVKVTVEKIYQPKPTDVEWRLTKGTRFQFFELVHLLGDVEEDSDEAEGYKEAIRSLPGFPTNYNPEVNSIVMDVTDIQFN